MPQRTPSCQLGTHTTPETRTISHPGDGTPCHTNEHLNEYSDGPGRGGTRLKVIAAAQWLTATTGRIATDPHSWLTAVHWIHGLATHGLYTPSQTHGPKWGPTTVAIAQEIAALKVCRPGIAYLMRKLKASERTIQYHLTMLRETGLLVYRSKGTRVRGQANEATVYERAIPAAFDEALGIRTVGEGVQRRPVGVADTGRKLIGKLAKKAARKVRRPRRRTPVSAVPRCTPMQVGTTGTSPTGLTHSPPESKLASGQEKSPTGKSSQRGPKKLNKIGRRYQLARELIQTVPWLQKASVPRIAWIIRHVADAGWTVTEVHAAAERMIVDKEARRPSAVLAFRLASCHLLYTTPGRRKTLVDDWRDSRIAAQARHSETVYDGYGYDSGPRTVASRRTMDEALAAIRDRLAPAIEEPVDLAPIALEDLSKAEVTDMRAAAMKDPGLIFSAIDLIGEAQTRRLYTNRLVDQTLALRAIAARNTILLPDF